MRPTTPYSKYLGDREPLTSMRETPNRLRALTHGWTSPQFERTYGPGKWTARQILTHLAQVELALGTRVRMALTVPGYVAQPFEQDAWIAKEPALDGHRAVAAFTALREMNLALFSALTPPDRGTSFVHPEYGTLTVDWVIHQMAGHDLNHLAQLEHLSQA